MLYTEMSRFNCLLGSFMSWIVLDFLHLIGSSKLDELNAMVLSKLPLLEMRKTSDLSGPDL
jgi:hypothetical protein